MFVKLAFRYSNSDKVVILMREKKEINIQIGKQVKLAREKSRLTQEQLAEQLECTPQYLSDLERGVVGISVALLKRLCVVLGVSSDDILFAEESKNTLETIEEKGRVLSDRQFQLLVEIVNRKITKTLPLLPHVGRAGGGFVYFSSL